MTAWGTHLRWARSKRRVPKMPWTDFCEIQWFMQESFSEAICWVICCIYCILPLCDLSAAFCDIRFNSIKHWLPMIVEACGPLWRDWFKILLLDSKIKVQPPSGQNGVLPKSTLITLLFEGPNLAGNPSRDVQCHAFCGEPSRKVFGKWWQVLPRCCCAKSRHCDLQTWAWSAWTN